jgi:hypothetical protein
MNDSEYNHPIWIGDHVLSHEFHYAWSILAFGDKWFSARVQRTAMMLHYASLTPKNVDNERVYQLAIYIKKNLAMAIPWHLKYADELLKVDCEVLMENLNRDADTFINLTSHDKNGSLSVYRKTLPDAMILKIEKTISGLEKYLASDDQKRFE